MESPADHPQKIQDRMNRVLFYDNLPSTEPPQGMVAVTRVYALNFDQMTGGDCAVLELIYRHLPGFDPSLEPQTWFGSSETSPPFLLASAEPSGLLVEGILRTTDWNDWHSQLLAGIESHPFPLHEF